MACRVAIGSALSLAALLGACGAGAASAATSGASLAEHEPPHRRPAVNGNGERDGDGIVDARDACPGDPEDLDGFEDDDGCPEPDNDRDGIPDVDDWCPGHPERLDGHADDDGCPD